MGYLLGCFDKEPNQAAIADIRKQTEDANIDDIKLTVIYDNVHYNGELTADWGFSCLVEGLDKTILFDTGRFDDAFMFNMSKLRINPMQIDEIVLSHDHPDHVGGVMKVLAVRPQIKVSLVKSFPSGFKNALRKRGAEVVDIKEPDSISKNAITTGEMKSFVKNEHALVILTNKGSIILTGCSHPGIVEIVERTKTITNKEVLLVAGGFHLLADYDSSIQKIAARLKKLGVRFVAPTHCTGAEAKKIFATVFGNGFLDGGVGCIITANDFVT